ncbi:MAG: extracellular solute-binding protein [Betaproteobacteria bacterium]|nr:extracellular solute-binding protein [Betaproteobacteria bacterium]
MPLAHTVARSCRVSPLAVLATLCTLFAASSTPAATPLELSHGLDAERAEKLGQLAERFNKSQKEYEIRLVARTGNSTPALLNLATHEDIARFADKYRKFRPLYQMMSQAKENFPADAVAPDMRAGVADAKGRMFALPLALSTPVLYYNKAMFKQAGLNPEQPPKTWPEVQAAAGKIREAGIECAYTTSWPAWVHIDNLSSWNGAPTAGPKNTLAFNGYLQIRHIALLASWVKGTYFTYYGRRDDADRHFAAGECGMLTSGSQLYATLRNAPALEIGVAPLPYYDDISGAPQRTLADGASLWIGAGYKPAQYKGAAKFISFILSPETQLELTLAHGYLPLTGAAQGAVQGKLLQEEALAFKVASPGLAAAGKTAPLPPLRVSQIEPVRIIIEEELESVWNNRKPAKAALDTAVKRANAVLPAALKAMLPQ